ncbi:MAG: hypothetical protein Ct9H300mP19_01810 [Dehalococcoidia bacterium]|nr:MAG: hypothetical protein Ct9H300mP19_01810 [Dehalococcoidia bacterium]
MPIYPQYLATGHSLRDSLVKTVGQLKRQYGCNAVATSEPSKVVGLRLGNAGESWLEKRRFSLYGLGYLALLSHTAEVVYLESGQVVEIESGSFRLFKFLKVNQSGKSVKTDQSFRAAQKGKYPGFHVKGDC